MVGKCRSAQQNRSIDGSTSKYNIFSVSTTACVANYAFMSGATFCIPHCYGIDLSLIILFLEEEIVIQLVRIILIASKG